MATLTLQTSSVVAGPAGFGPDRAFRQARPSPRAARACVVEVRWEDLFSLDDTKLRKANSIRKLIRCTVFTFQTVVRVFWQDGSNTPAEVGLTTSCAEKAGLSYNLQCRETPGSHRVPIDASPARARSANGLGEGFLLCPPGPVRAYTNMTS